VAQSPFLPSGFSACPDKCNDRLRLRFCIPSNICLTRFGAISSHLSPIVLQAVLRHEPRAVSCTPQEVLDHFERPEESTESGPAHFVCNAGELGHQEWANQHGQTCFDPVFHPGDQVGYPVSQASKQIALLACNAADGSPAMPLMIIPRKTLDKELRPTGMTPGEVMTRSESKGHQTTTIEKAS
jgi:hypothetical protein